MDKTRDKVFELATAGAQFVAEQVPYAAIQALRRPDVTAKLHVLEFPFYLGLLWISVTHLGITGAALAWLLRVILDAGMLFWISHRLLPTGNTRISAPFMPLKWTSATAALWWRHFLELQRNANLNEGPPVKTEKIGQSKKAIDHV